MVDKADVVLTPSRGATAITNKTVQEKIQWQPPTIVLPDFEPTIDQQQKSLDNATPVQIGQHRPLDKQALDDSALACQQQPADDRCVIALEIVSPPAEALRVGIDLTPLPDSAIVMISSAHDDTAWKIAVGDAKMLLQAAYREAQDAIKQGLTVETPVYWTPSTLGDQVVVAIQFAPNTDEQVAISQFKAAVQQISHLTVAPFDRLTTKQIGDSASCNLDIRCQSNYDQTVPAKATAQMAFSSGSGSYICTGTLINDSSNSQTPHFLTARHCISTATAAASLETGWFFEAASCDSTSVSSEYTRLSNGADLLASVADNDMTLLRLHDQPPTGVPFAGVATDYGILAAIVGIHHPSGDLKKISFGDFSDFSGYGAAGNDHIRVTWNQGTTEGGSSGSGLFSEESGLLLGTLHGGSASCVNQTAPDYYGRFDQAYTAAFADWLSSDSPDPATCESTSIASNETISGSWSTTDCNSLNREGAYADYYHFTLTATATVTIDLTSSGVDTFAYLIAGDQRSGLVLVSNDDGGAGTNARIEYTLSPGTYTIEATTFSRAQATGSYTLQVQTQIDQTCSVLPISIGDHVTGEWSSGSCQSINRPDHYASYYSVQVTTAQTVTIDLQSSTDTYLFLMDGSEIMGTVLAFDDDGGEGTSSRIEYNLAPGTYTIEATTFGSHATGSYTLSIDNTMTENCSILTAQAVNTGSWTATDCEAFHRSGRYADHYHFTIAALADVIIDLESATDTYLFLLAGQSATGTIIASDDDGGEGRNSHIEYRLAAGDYTIAATTYATNATGDYTLTIAESAAAEHCTMTDIALGSVTTGQWTSDDCTSTHREGRYADHYRLTVTRATTIAIDLESDDSDAYLFLLDGADPYSPVVNSDDDGGRGTNSHIEYNLDPGIYTIQATTYSAEALGTYRLTVQPVITEQACRIINIPFTDLDNAALSGTWSTQDCISENRDGSFAQYYTFRIQESVELEISLDSSTVDTYLYVLDGYGPSGTVIVADDDSGDGVNSRIQRVLEAGTYTVETTTYSPTAQGQYYLNLAMIRQVEESDQQSLRLIVVGDGQIQSPTASITCADVCEYLLTDDTELTLTAVANDANASFIGWGGDCDHVEPTCSLSMSDPHTVIAAFGGAAPLRQETTAWKVAEIYMATMGYAPDNEGLQYWIQNIDTLPQWTPETVAQSFFDQTLVQAEYPESAGYGAFIDALYRNIFGRGADTQGYNYWLDELESGRVLRNQMIVAMINGGWDNPSPDALSDMQRFGYRIEVALEFARYQAEHGIAYSQLSEADQALLRQLGADVLVNVTDDAATRDAAIASIPELLSTLGTGDSGKQRLLHELRLLQQP
jgi:hypothetical protein